MGGQTTAVRRVVRTVFTLLTVLLTSGSAAWAQPDAPPGVPPGMASRLAAERVGAVQGGIYSAGEDNNFTLEPYTSAKYLLRFSGHPETFVLNVERASLGAKLLKYDTGTTALRISVWGGLTLYTQDAPQGIPATYQGVAPASQPLAISAGELPPRFSPIGPCRRSISVGDRSNIASRSRRFAVLLREPSAPT